MLMRFAIIAAALAWAAISAGPAPAQNPPAAPAVQRTILAGTKLPDLAAGAVGFFAPAGDDTAECGEPHRGGIERDLLSARRLDRDHDRGRDQDSRCGRGDVCCRRT